MLTAFENFKNGVCNWIELTVVSEEIQLLAKPQSITTEEVGMHLTKESACFIALKLRKKTSASNVDSDINFFVFFCPDEAPVRVKMTMSSSKASVITAARKQDLFFDK